MTTHDASAESRESDETTAIDILSEEFRALGAVVREAAGESPWSVSVAELGYLVRGESARP